MAILWNIFLFDPYRTEISYLYLTFCGTHALVHHSTDARVAPYVLRCLHHVDDSEDGEDDAHDAYRSSRASHERESEEVASHGYTSIAHGREDGYEQPEEDGGQVDVCAPVLEDEE